MGVHTLEDLQQFQALPLNLKIRLTQTRIRTWVNEFGSDGVYVSFSGGKDSTVLLDIVRKMYPEIEAVFCDTGLEYPEIREFVKTFDNVTWLKPKMSFFQVCEKYGFPLISKEVSECVYGARKYLTSVIELASLDRQTDRQTDIRIDNFTKRFVDSVAMQKQTRGGQDRKYRKLRGLGEFTKQEEYGKSSWNMEQGQSKVRSNLIKQRKSAETVRDSSGTKGIVNDGEYP